MSTDLQDPHDSSPPGPAGIPAISYDAVPYPARAFPWSHPERVATVLTLLGLRPPPLENCRVLDLGCATGGNLLPMAEDLTGGRFVGLDVSRVQIETARAVARRLGLRNVEFRCQDLVDWGRGDGGEAGARGGADSSETFDYIIAHGLYSWVPAAVRDRLLELCARHLAPGGAAFVSYNAFPGWHAHAAIREMMLTHVWGAGAEPGSAVPETPEQVLAKAREVLEFLSVTNLAEGPYGAVLREAAVAARTLPDANLLHDYLGPINQPTSVSQFAAHAAGKGLRYLGDAHPLAPPGAFKEGRRPGPQDRDKSDGSEPSPVQLASLASTPLRAEQLADTLRNRPFRQSLLCRADARPEPLEPSAAGGDSFADAGLDARQIRRLHVASATRPPAAEVEFGTPTPEDFTTPRGATMTVSDPLLKSALRCLAEAWPARPSFAAVLDAAWRRMGLGAGSDTGSDTGADRLCTGLLHAFLAGAIELSVRPVPCVAGVTRRPAARRLARVQAETGDTVTTLRHENLQLNATARQLLVLLDGAHDFTALASILAEIVQDNARNIDPSLTLTEEDCRQLAQGLQQDLRRLAAEGVLVG